MNVAELLGAFSEGSQGSAINSSITTTYLNCGGRLTIESFSTILNSFQSSILVLADVGIRTYRTLANDQNLPRNVFISSGESKSHTLVVLAQPDVHIFFKPIIPGVAAQIRYKSITFVAVYYPTSLDSKALGEILDSYSSAPFPAVVIGDMNARLGALTDDDTTCARGTSLMESFKKFRVLVKQTTTTGKSCVDQVLVNASAASRRPCVSVGNVSSLKQVKSDHKPISVSVFLLHSRYRINRGELRKLADHGRLKRHKPWRDFGWCNECAKIELHRSLLESAFTRIDTFQQTGLRYFNAAAAVEITSGCVAFALKVAAIRTVGVRKVHHSDMHSDSLSSSFSNPKLIRHVSLKLNAFDCEHRLDLDDPDTISRFFPPRINTPLYPRYESHGNSFTFTIKALTDLVSRVKRRKSIDHDGLCGEMLILSARPTACLLLNLFALIQATGRAPRSWKISDIIPILKKAGRENEPNSYRPISIISSIRKLFERSIYRYIESRLQISDIQGGFSRGRGTISNAAIAHSFFSANPDNIHLLLDLKSAFDSVDRGKLVTLIYAKTCNPGLSMAFQDMFSNNVGRLRGAFRYHAIHDGVQQGAPLSPLLFNAFLDQLNQFLPPHILSVSNRDKECLVLYYADDILISAPSSKIQAFLDACEQFTELTGMRFAPSKSVQLNGTNLSLANEQIPIKEATKYLGISFKNDGIDAAQVYSSIAQARSVIRRLNSQFDLAALSLAQRSLLAKTFIVPHLEYGAQLYQMAGVDFRQLIFVYRAIMNKVLLLPSNSNTTFISLALNLHAPDTRFSALGLIFLGRSGWLASNEKSQYHRLVLRFATRLTETGPLRNVMFDADAILRKKGEITLKKISEAIQSAMRSLLIEKMENQLAPRLWMLLKPIFDDSSKELIAASLRNSRSHAHWNSLLSGNFTFDKIFDFTNHLSQYRCPPGI